MARLTLAEAGDRLGRSASTLRNQVRAGRLRATLVGKTYTVTEAEVERYRREHLGRGGRPRIHPRPAPDDAALAPDAQGFLSTPDELAGRV